MNGNIPTPNRRSVLKTLGGGAAAAAVGGAALLASTGAVAANNFTINNSSVTLNDGQVSYVGVDIGGTVSWDGFDTPVTKLRFVSEVKIAGEDWHVLNDTTSDPLGDWSGDGDANGWGGDGEYVMETKDGGREGKVHTTAKWVVIGDGTDPADYRTAGLDIPDWTASVSVDADGESDTTSVSKRSTVYFLDADGNEVGVGSVQSSDSFDVTVTNQAATTGGSSSGDSTAG